MSAPPGSTRFEEVLEELARRLARAPVHHQQRRVYAKVAVVTVGPERFAVPVDGVREIVPTPPLAPLPGLPPWLPGIVQLRGEILCAVSLARWLGLTPAPREAFLALLEGAEGPLGLLVEAVLEFRDLHEDELATAFQCATGERARPVCAMTRDLVAVLDVPRLLSHPDLRTSRP